LFLPLCCRACRGAGAASGASGALPPGSDTSAPSVADLTLLARVEEPADVLLTVYLAVAMARTSEDPPRGGRSSPTTSVPGISVSTARGPGPAGLSWAGLALQGRGGIVNTATADNQATSYQPAAAGPQTVAQKIKHDSKMTTTTLLWGCPRDVKQSAKQLSVAGACARPGPGPDGPGQRRRRRRGVVAASWGWLGLAAGCVLGASLLPTRTPTNSGGPQNGHALALGTQVYDTVTLVRL
ncbi:Putative glutamate--cysteine ligase 2, partial [Frankliniella fusca]